MPGMHEATGSIPRTTKGKKKKRPKEYVPHKKRTNMGFELSGTFTEL